MRAVIDKVLGRKIAIPGRRSRYSSLPGRGYAVSEKRRLRGGRGGVAPAFLFLQNVGDPALIGAKHRGDDMFVLASRIQKQNGFPFGARARLGLADRDDIEFHPGDGVSVRGHGLSFRWLCATRPALAGHGRVKVARTAYRGAVSRTGRLTENRSPGIYILRSESKATQEHLSASISGIPALGYGHSSLLNFGRGPTPPAFSAAGVV